MTQTRDIEKGCTPLTVNFDNTNSPSDSVVTWAWNFGDGQFDNTPSPSHTFNTAGTYTVSLQITTRGNCVWDSASKNGIEALVTPLAKCAVSSNDTFPNMTILFYNKSIDSDSCLWKFGDGNGSLENFPRHSYSGISVPGQPYIVHLFAYNRNGCQDSCSQQIYIKNDISFPTIFNPSIPNTDQKFKGYSSRSIVDLSLTVFNRWGEIMYSSTDIDEGWDGYYKGKLSKQDVYVWHAVGKLNDGRSFNLKGHVTLVY